SDPAAGAAPGRGAALAEPGQRLVARLIDTLIVGPPVAVIARAFLPQSAYGVRPAETATAVGVAVVYLLYDTIQHALWGRTIGKRLTGIRVVSAGRPGDSRDLSDPGGGRGRVELPRAALRAAVFALPIAARPVPVLGLIAGIFWVANAAWVLESTRRQALHDRLAATRVVRAAVAARR
ncbi:MAG TPA: RDD family protein, partial [Streptosporangiaceae bacterium]